MNSTIAVLITIVAVLGVGLIGLARRHRALSAQLSFAVEFTSRLTEFVNAQAFDGQRYTWLTQHAVQMQEDLGPLGIVDYKPPGTLAFIRRYQVILNLLPELRRLRMGEYHFGVEDIFREQANLCLDTLVRYSGVQERRSVQSLSQLRNPLAWLREGVQTTLLVPVSLLVGLGILGTSTQTRFRDSLLFRVLAGIVALIGLLSAVMTIALGWQQFTALVNRLFRGLTP